MSSKYKYHKNCSTLLGSRWKRKERTKHWSEIEGTKYCKHFLLQVYIKHTTQWRNINTGLYLDAVIVGLLPIMAAASVSIWTVIHWRIPHEAMLQGLITLLMPLKMPNHFFLLDKNPWITVQAMEVLPVTKQWYESKERASEGYWLSQTKQSVNTRTISQGRVNNYGHKWY